MANRKVTQLPELTTTPEADDVLYIIDKSDLTESADGTSKQIRVDKFVSGSGGDPLKEDKINKQDSLAVDGTGTKYPTVDAVNDAIPASYAVVVYVNATSPNTATIFDDVNPPVTNDDALKIDTDNLYIGTDASTWVYNGTTYITKTIAPSSNFKIVGTGVDAGSNKTSDITREGSIASEGNISTELGFYINRNGSNTPQIGGFLSFSNAIGSNSMVWQMNASNGLDLWAYVSSTWTKIATFTNAGNLTANNLSGTNTGDETTASLKTKIDEYLGFACSDEVSNLATGLVTTFRMPYAMTLTGVRISLTTAPTISSVIVDVKQGGTSIFSTLVSIDSGELTSVTAATPAVISTTALTDDSLMTIHITQIGSGDTGKGLKLVLSGKKS